MQSKSLILVATLAGFAIGAATLVEPTAPLASAPSDAATYVGADTCKKCHFPQHKTWKDMKHAGAWEALPEKFRDPAQVDDAGRACISCHVTGFGHGDKGGFVDIATSANLTGVQCEACHGPGSEHVEKGGAMLKEKRKKLDPGEESHITRKTANCSDCHNPHINHSQYKEG